MTFELCCRLLVREPGGLELSWQRLSHWEDSGPGLLPTLTENFVCEANTSLCAKLMRFWNFVVVVVPSA